MSEITLALEHPSLGCGEIIARYDLSEIQEKAYQQGRADKYQEITSEYMLLNENQVADIRADAFSEVYDRIDAGVCEICDCKDFDKNCYKHCQEEMRVVMKWLKENKND